MDIYFDHMLLQAARVSVSVVFLVFRLWYIDIMLPWHHFRCYLLCGLFWPVSASSFFHFPWQENLRYKSLQISINLFIYFWKFVSHLSVTLCCSGYTVHDSTGISWKLFLREMSDAIRPTLSSNKPTIAFVSVSFQLRSNSFKNIIFIFLCVPWRWKRAFNSTYWVTWKDCINVSYSLSFKSLFLSCENILSWICFSRGLD